MTYQTWRAWLTSLPWSLRWFVLLVLLRPVLNAFWFVKETSLFLSPLYIVGVLTPCLIVASFMAPRFPKARLSLLDVPLGVWMWLLFMNAGLILLAEANLMNGLEGVLYLTTPPLVYVFVRHLIRSREDLMGLLTTVMYSLVVPFAMILFEAFVSPLSAQESRGLTRVHGLYGDVASYGLYISCGLLAAGYLFFDERSQRPLSQRALVLAAVMGVSLVGLLNIHHATSWAVALGLFALFLLYGLTRQFMVSAAVVMVLLGGTLLFAGEELQERYDAIVGREVEMFEKNGGQIDNMFHGRGTRWLYFLDFWEQTSAVSKLVGVSFDYADPYWQGRLPVHAMTMKGAHNDFLRTLFAAGIVGLIAYALFLVLVAVRGLARTGSDGFLIMGALCILVLYSISLTPSLYDTSQYVCFSIFAYAALRKQPQIPEAPEYPEPRTFAEPPPTELVPA